MLQYYSEESRMTVVFLVWCSLFSLESLSVCGYTERFCDYMRMRLLVDAALRLSVRMPCRMEVFYPC